MYSQNSNWGYFFRRIGMEAVMNVIMIMIKMTTNDVNHVRSDIFLAIEVWQ
jgi:hypothetical protein